MEVAAGLSDSATLANARLGGRARGPVTSPGSGTGGHRTRYFRTEFRGSAFSLRFPED